MSLVRTCARRDAAQVEQREAERRVHERGLHVHAQHHAEPDQIDAQLFRHRRQQRHDDERDLEKIQEEREQEHHHVHHDQEAQLAARQAGSRCSTHRSPFDAAEHQANTVEPIRMNITKLVILAVVSSAWRSTSD
jgi:hypothetical protein